MIKDDYSSKISEELISLIKEIKTLHNLKSDVLMVIDAAYKKFLGMSSGFINSVSQKDLLELMRKNDKIQGNSCAVAAALLYEEGKIFDADNNQNDAYSRYIRAFNLISNIFTMDLDCEIEGYKATADSLAATLQGFELLPEDQIKLYDYYYVTNAYSKAEDCLYEMLDCKETKTYAIEKLNEFYNKLLLKTDEELIAGNLPREEILDALKNI